MIPLFIRFRYIFGIGFHGRSMSHSLWYPIWWWLWWHGCCCFLFMVQNHRLKIDDTIQKNNICDTKSVVGFWFLVNLEWSGMTSKQSTLKTKDNFWLKIFSYEMQNSVTYPRQPFLHSNRLTLPCSSQFTSNSIPNDIRCIVIHTKTKLHFE